MIIQSSGGFNVLEEMRALIDFIERREKGTLLREIAERRLKTLDTDRFKVHREVSTQKPNYQKAYIADYTQMDSSLYQVLPKKIETN